MTTSSNPYLRQALDLAWEVAGSVYPRPAVGAVVVKDGVVVGKGTTEPRPGKHAERLALDEAGEAARGATLYCSLEPHSVPGVAAPCTDAIIASGVAKVVVATIDPSPGENGNGVAALKAANIEVVYGTAEERTEADDLIEGLCHQIKQKRPLIVGKIAVSLDGKFVAADGTSQWITGKAAREQAHTVRARADAIVTGIETVLADDPRLTARRPAKETKYPVRIVLDSNARLPSSAKLLNEAGSVIWITAKTARPTFEKENLEHISVDCSDDGLDLNAVMELLLERSFSWVLFEGGGKLLGSLLRQNLVDKLNVYVAPLIMGETARSAFQIGDITTLSDALHLDSPTYTRLGDDFLVSAYVRRELCSAG